MGLFSFLKSKPKHIFNENGENIIYFKKKKEGIKCKFYKKNGALHGIFTTYYLQNMTPEITPSIKVNFVDGVVHGDATEYSTYARINRFHEIYENGSLVSKKVYYTGVSRKGDLASEKVFKQEDCKKGLLLESIESIIREYKISNSVNGLKQMSKRINIKDSSNENLENEIEKKLLNKISLFDEQSYADKYETDIQNFEINYWYGIIINRVKTSNSLVISDDLDYELKSLIWGHADEYGKKHINKESDFKRMIALTRIICFGHIYAILFEINNEINSYLIISESYRKEIKDRLFHVKASVYGAIKFALFSGISKEDIKSWFPDFEDNEELITGINALEEQINNTFLKGDNSDNKNLQKLEGIYDGEKRVQIYELNELERLNIPDWFKGPFYTKGGVSTSKLTEKKYNLNALEKSIFTEIQYNTGLIQIVSESDNISRESFNNPYFEYLVQVVDEGTEWFKKNNSDAYNKLFEVNEKASLKLNSNDDKLVALIGLMISLVQQDDVFCDQEKVYIENFISQLSETKRHEITEKLIKKELSGLISIVETLDAEDQNDILNKLIEIAAVDNKIDGKEAYLICFLANSINLEVQQVVGHMVESYDFDPKLLDEEISRMNDENKEASQGNDKNFKQKSEGADTSTVIGYRRHTKL